LLHSSFTWLPLHIRYYRHTLAKRRSATAKSVQDVRNFILDRPDILGFRMAWDALGYAVVVAGREGLCPYYAHGRKSTHCVCAPSDEKPRSTLTCHDRYISDIGAHELQPLFIAAGTVTVVTFTLTFVAERWLRHRGRLVKNDSTAQKILSGFAIAFALIGMIGLIILTCLNDVEHGTAHDICLVIFMYVWPLSPVKPNKDIPSTYNSVALRQKADTISTAPVTLSQQSSSAPNINASE